MQKLPKLEHLDEIGYWVNIEEDDNKPPAYYFKRIFNIRAEANSDLVYIDVRLYPIEYFYVNYENDPKIKKGKPIMYDKEIIKLKDCTEIKCIKCPIDKVCKKLHLKKRTVVKNKGNNK